MRKLKAEDLTGRFPMRVGEGKLSLPTRGADAVYVGCKVNPETKEVLYYSVRGNIHPVDPSAPDIIFQINLPVVWNGIAVQYGGFSFDGILEDATKTYFGQCFDDVPPAEAGYVTFGSDGGHEAREGAAWDSEFALNDEALRNFAWESVKKTRDAAIVIIREVYGELPKRLVIAGGSNGGREVLKAIQNAPEDYDGAICLFPVLNWVGKAISDSHNADVITENAEKGWISAEIFRKIKDIIRDAGSGRKEEDAPDPRQVAAQREEVPHRLEQIMSPEQLDTLREFAEDYIFEYALANGIRTVPGYRVLAGAAICDAYFNQFGSRGERDGFMAQFGDAVIRYQIMRDAAFSPVHFDAAAHREEVQRASALLDATSPCLDAYFAHGGKLILVHGTADQLVSLGSSVQYYESLERRFGEEKLRDSARFFIIPGYGHGFCEEFTMGSDLLGMMEKWLEEGTAPDVLTAIDQNEGHEKRRQRIPCE